jgi:hypothetical protein
VNVDHFSTLHSLGHGSSLQSSNSTGSTSGQGAPPCSGPVILRLRVRFPVSQVAEQALQPVQSSTTQSTGSKVGAAVGTPIGAGVGATVGAKVGLGDGARVGAGVGQASMPQGCSCSTSTGQANPPSSGSSTTSRVRVCVPPPHSAVQFPQSSQSDMTQSFGQGSTLQSSVSKVFGQAFPPYEGGRVTSRVRFWIPPSQLAEHALGSLHSPTRQCSTHG